MKSGRHSLWWAPALWLILASTKGFPASFDACQDAYLAVVAERTNTAKIFFRHLEPHQNQIADLLRRSVDRMLHQKPGISMELRPIVDAVTDSLREELDKKGRKPFVAAAGNLTERLLDINNELAQIVDAVTNSLRKELDESGRKPFLDAADAVTRLIVDQAERPLFDVSEYEGDTPFDRARREDIFTDDQIRVSDMSGAFHDLMVSVEFPPAYGFNETYEFFEIALERLIQQELNQMNLPFRTETMLGQIRGIQPSTGLVLVYPSYNQKAQARTCEVLTQEPGYRAQPRVIVDAYFGEGTGASLDLMAQATDVVVWPSLGRLNLPFKPHPETKRVVFLGLDVTYAVFVVHDDLLRKWFEDGRTEVSVELDPRVTFFDADRYPQASGKLGVGADLFDSDHQKQYSLEALLRLPRPEAEKMLDDFASEMVLGPFGNDKGKYVSATQPPANGNLFPRHYVFTGVSTGRVIRIEFGR